MIKDLQLYDFKNKDFCLQQLTLDFLNRMSNAFVYNNLPDTLPSHILERYLLERGHCAIIEHEGNLYPMFGGLCGREKSPVYEPTQITIANPALKISKVYTDNVDCVIIRNDFYYKGLLEILRRYLSIQVEGNLSLYNFTSFGSRIQSLISASDDKTVKSAQKYLEDTIRGQVGVIAETPFLEGLKVSPLTTNSNANLVALLQLLQYNQAELFKILGINTNSASKRESLSSEETNADELMTQTLIDVYEFSRKDGIDRVNKLFGTDITVEKNGAFKIQEEEIEQATEEPEEEQPEETEQEDEKDDDNED